MGNIFHTVLDLLKSPSFFESSSTSSVLPGLIVKWLGCAGVMLSDGSTTLLIDPFVSRYGLWSVVMGKRLVPKVAEIRSLLTRLAAREVEAVLVSHSHYDHALDAPFFAKETGAYLIGSNSTANIGRGAGLDAIRIVEHGSRLDLGRFQVTVLESEHGPGLFSSIPFPGDIEKPLKPPARAYDYRLGKTFSFVIAHEAGTIVHHGSAGFRKGMYEGIHADVVLLGIAGRGDTETYLREVVDQTGARIVVPIHFDDFFSPISTPPRLLPGIEMDEFVKTALTRKNIGLSFLPIT